MTIIELMRIADKKFPSKPWWRVRLGFVEDKFALFVTYKSKQFQIVVDDLDEWLTISEQEFDKILDQEILHLEELVAPLLEEDKKFVAECMAQYSTPFSTPV